ncbi:MAG: PASTA domain-containing protein [Candidatus Riflebacteria bacterium]|nr:PASTA domain-containing protein [Candidatus Riflebacteria bacterium]
MRNKTLKPRIYRVFCMMLLAIVVIIVFVIRLGYLQIFQHDRWSELSKKNHISKRVLDVKRGVISDRNGMELAISVETYHIYLYTPEVKDLNAVAVTLSSVLPISRDEILKKCQKAKYVLLCKNIELNLANKIRQMNIPGINLESHYQRYYPQKTLAANVLGFCGADQEGLEGLEKLYDKTLKGYPGVAIQEDISLSKSNGAATLKTITPPMGGSNITLTIDTFIQHILENELKELAEKYDPLDTTAIVADPYTGEILGMACYPTYDLNNFGKSKAFNIKNRPATDMFEPGSCIKIIAAATALENHRINSSTRFYCKGYGELTGPYHRKMKCTGHHGLLDINEAVAKSCNAAMLQLSQLVEPEMIYRMYKRFGLGEPTGIEVLSESNGILHPPSKWSAFSPSSLCIGQELTVTCLQLIQAYSAIANGGKLIRPRLIKKISSADGSFVQDFEPEVIRKVVSPQLSIKLRSMLRGVVDEGGGYRAALEDYTSGGKTSTAQKPDGKGGYSNEKLVTSFIGMAPAMEPKIVVFVALNEPKGDVKTMFGSRLAAPSFAKICEKVLKYMKVPPDKNTGNGINSLLKLTANSDENAEKTKDENIASLNKTDDQNSLGENKNLVPNLIGKSLKGAIQTVNNLGLKAIYDGDGIVVKQLPPAGRPFPASKILRIKLSPTISE